jgi:recombinational DNA repair protein (RecF pathway)
MHHIYTTPAFIIHSSPHGEAGKFLLLFTRDFGMIGATAQGIRLQQSKLRFHVQDGNFSNVSVVRGKEVWRLTGAVEIEHEKATVLHLKILRILKRLLHGEDKNDKLFEIVEVLYGTNINESDYEVIECLTILRILNTLGYIKNNDELLPFLSNTDLNQDILSQFSNIKARVINIINNALKESQL